MIIVHSSNKKKHTPTNSIAKEKVISKRDYNSKSQKIAHKIDRRRCCRINSHLKNCRLHIKTAVRNSDELYEILRNICPAPLNRNKEIDEIYKTIQSVHEKLRQLNSKGKERQIKKIRLIEEIIEYLKKAVNSANNFIQLKIDRKSGEVEEKLEEINAAVRDMSLNFLKIQNENNPNEETRAEIRNLKEEKVKAQRAKSKNKARKNYKNYDITNAKVAAIKTIEKLIPLCKKFKIVLPENLIKIEETDRKQYKKYTKSILESIEEVRKKLEEEMNNKNSGDPALKKLQEKEREITALEERTKQNYFRIINDSPPMIRRKKNRAPRTKFSQRSEQLKSFLSHSQNLFKNLEEACETSQKNLSYESEQYKEIQEVRKNIENNKLIIKDKIRKTNVFIEKVPYLIEIKKNTGDMIEKIQEILNKNEKKTKQIELELARKLLSRMDGHSQEIVKMTDEIEGYSENQWEINEEKSDMSSELEDLEEDIFPEEDHEELSLKSQASDDYIYESLSDNPMEKLLKTHIGHDPMEQEEQSIKIKTTSKPKISKKHKIGLEIDFSEASKSSDDNSDEDLYDRGPYKKTKKKNYVESKYIEEDEL